MTFGIVVVTFECRELARDCLASIARQLPAAMETTVVVDNTSSDGTVEMVAQDFPEARIIRNARNEGFAAAVNQGIVLLPRCSVICILNPDTLLLDSGLLEAERYLEVHAGVGVLGARIENADGSLQLSCRAFPGHLNALFNRHSLVTKLIPGNRWSREYLMSDWRHDEVREVDWVSGACMLAHRRAIERVGVLDPGYFFSIEDVDYCRRVRDVGLAVEYFPMARVQHRVGGSSRHAVFRAMAAHHRGMWRYYRKHLSRNAAIDVLTALGIAIRFFVHAASYTLRTATNRLLRRPNA